MMNHTNQGGYVALLAVLLAGAVSVAVAVTLLVTGVDSQRTSLVSIRSTQARSLAGSCAEEALEQVNAATSFIGSGNLTLGQETCTYSVANTGATTKAIAATGTVGPVTREVNATITLSSVITINTWQESTVGALPMHVQSTGVAGGVGTGTSTVPFSSNVTAGSLIVTSATWDTGGGVVTMSCADNRGNAYSTVNVWNDTTNGQALGICYAPNAAAGATTVTITYGTGSVAVAFRSAIVSEYSGVATVSPVDVSTGVGGATATTATDAVTSGSIATTNAGDLIYGSVMDTTSPTTIDAGTSGFTQRFSLNAKELAVQDRYQAITGSVASTQTFGATHRYDAAMVAFKAAP